MAEQEKICCGKHCFNVLCFPVWAVIIIGIILGILLLLYNCNIRNEFIHNDNHLIFFFVAIGCIFFVVLFSIVFLVLIKIPAIYICCAYFKNIWIILHISLMAAVAIVIVSAKPHTTDEWITILTQQERILEKPGKLSTWFMDLQNDKKCCGLRDSSDYGTIILPALLIVHCPKRIIELLPTMAPTTETTSNATFFGNTTTETTNSITGPSSPLAETIKTGCGPQIEDDCQIAAYRYVLVMLVLGVISFVCYSLVYKEVRKQQAKYDAEIAANSEDDIQSPPVTGLTPCSFLDNPKMNV